MRTFKLNFRELVYPTLFHVERRLKLNDVYLFLLNVVYVVFCEFCSMNFVSPIFDIFDNFQL